MEVTAGDEFSTALIGYQTEGKSYEAALTAVLESYVVANPLVKYYAGTVWVSPLTDWASSATEMAGQIETSIFQASWEMDIIQSGLGDEKRTVPGVCSFACTVELREPPTVQLAVADDSVP